MYIHKLHIHIDDYTGIIHVYKNNYMCMQWEWRRCLIEDETAHVYQVEGTFADAPRYNIGYRFCIYTRTHTHMYITHTYTYVYIC